MGQAGRAHVTQFYDRVALAREYRKILEAAGGEPVRLLVTGGSGFLGGYVLDEAARRGHEVVALARSDAAAEAVTARGAKPLTGDLDDPAQLPGIFAAADCEGLVNLASLGFGHAPAIVAAARVSRPGPGRVHLHDGGDHLCSRPAASRSGWTRSSRSATPGWTGRSCGPP